MARPTSRRRSGADGERGRCRLLVILLAVALLGALSAAALAACGEELAPPSPNSQIDKAKDVSMKTQILSIKTGIQAYIAQNGQLPPTADQNTLGAWVQPWPDNPYTKVPMKPGPNPGEYTYTPMGGNSFTLVAHLAETDYTVP